MKKGLFVVSFIFSILVATYSFSGAGTVLHLSVNGVINPVSAEYVERGIEKAIADRSEAILIELDTPGGLDTSMRKIIKAINSSSVPVIVYVSPSGARAASAGVFMTMAAHIAAMSPGTNIGAAHPVNMGGKMDETMSEKVTNDSVAYIRSIAEKHGRNADWAEKAVRKSVSITESEALKLNVIDVVASTISDLLRSIHGKKVETADGEKTLNTIDANVTKEEMGLRLKILSVISDPNIAYILMLLGFYGLFFELTNPGSIFPGVLGGICLILAFYSFQTLPVNYAGVLLIILGIIMFILEIKIVSYGVLTIGGIISMIIGSVMLFETASPFIRLSLQIIFISAAATALFFLVVVRLVYRAWKAKPVTGSEGIVGLEGTALTDILDSGMALVHGEYWQAQSEERIEKGDSIIVKAVQGLKLVVTRKQ